jgi:hypothetical protein
MSERTDSGGLPDTLDGFIEAAEQRTCERCEDEVHKRYIEDGLCVGCRHSPAVEDGGRDV